jgi:hypothetical protein
MSNARRFAWHCLLVLFCLSMHSGEMRAADPAAPERSKWEYGCLESSVIGVTWYTGGLKEVTGKDWGDLAREMKVNLMNRPVSNSACRTEILNFLGEQGWELVTISEVPGAGKGSFLWTFKRQRK